MARRPRAGQKTGGSTPGRLRIVAGKWRSRELPVVAGDGLRPTSERIRETLFNWLGSTVEGAHCLDLCAGTGALGLEALSRGAATATFVESSARAVNALQAAAAALDAQDTVIHHADAVQFLGARTTTPFGIAFIDPPYAADLQGELCRLLAAGGWLASDAQVYLEQQRAKAEPSLPAGWRIVRDKTAGRVRYLLLSVLHPASEQE